LSKIKIKTLLSQNNKILISENYNGIKTDNLIKYNENEIKNIFDIENKILKRINKEYEIIIDFKNKTGKYLYNNFEIPIKVKVLKQYINDFEIYIKYKLYLDTEDLGIFIYKINYEVKLWSKK